MANPMKFEKRGRGPGKSGTTTVYDADGQGYVCPDGDLKEAIAKGYLNEKPKGVKSPSAKSNLEKAHDALVKLSKAELAGIPAWIKTEAAKAIAEAEKAEAAKAKAKAEWEAGAEARRTAAAEKAAALLKRAAKLQAQIERAQKAAAGG